VARELIIGIRVSEMEKKELQKRADNAHLKLSSYARWFLFNAGLFVQSKGEPIERISKGVPKRIVTSHTVKQMSSKKEVMAEMKAIFEEGVQLKALEFDDLTETGRSWKAKKTLEQLTPPPDYQ